MIRGAYPYCILFQMTQPKPSRRRVKCVMSQTFHLAVFQLDQIMVCNQSRFKFGMALKLKEVFTRAK